MTLFDLIAIVVILLSVLAGLSNGAVRELVGLFAFGLAVGGAILILPLSRPLARAVVNPSWAASGAAIVVGFLVIYIILQVGGRFLTARLRDAGALGALDRIGGGGIGAIRAGVLLGAFFLVYHAATPPERRPGWIERAALLPVASSAATALQSIAPKGVAAAGRLGPTLKNALASPDPDAGIQLGGNARDTDEETRPATARPPSHSGHNTRHRREPASSGRAASRDGLDVVVEPSR